MKLKKIASLALAGVMAVSMLAGCKYGEGSSSSTVNPPVDDGTPATGYSSLLGEELVSKNPNTRKLSMSDSTALNNDLQSALAYAADSDIAWRYDNDSNDVIAFVNPTGSSATHLVADRLIAIADADNAGDTTLGAAFDELNPLTSDPDNEDKSIVVLYVVDAGVGMEAAIERVANDMVDEVAGLVNTYNANGTAGETHEISYKYTGSVSADTITVDADHGKGMTFIAVQINRVVV